MKEAFTFTNEPRDPEENDVVRTLTCTNTANGRTCKGTILASENILALQVAWIEQIKGDGEDVWMGGIFHALARAGVPVRLAAANQGET